jgi:hypothetical protein
MIMAKKEMVCDKKVWRYKKLFFYFNNNDNKEKLGEKKTGFSFLLWSMKCFFIFFSFHGIQGRTVHITRWEKSRRAPLGASKAIWAIVFYSSYSMTFFFWQQFFFGAPWKIIPPKFREPIHSLWYISYQRSRFYKMIIQVNGILN